MSGNGDQQLPRAPLDRHSGGKLFAPKRMILGYWTKLIALSVTAVFSALAVIDGAMSLFNPHHPADGPNDYVIFPRTDNEARLLTMIFAAPFAAALVWALWRLVALYRSRSRSAD